MPETLIKRETSLWGDLYRRRTSVEREFGRLKHEYGLRSFASEASSASDSTLTS